MGLYSCLSHQSSIGFISLSYLLELNQSILSATQAKEPQVWAMQQTVIYHVAPQQFSVDPGNPTNLPSPNDCNCLGTVFLNPKEI